jgi:hypothetical protein
MEVHGQATCHKRYAPLCVSCGQSRGTAGDGRVEYWNDGMLGRETDTGNWAGAPVIGIFSAIYAFLAPIHSPSSLQFRCSFQHSIIPTEAGAGREEWNGGWVECWGEKRTLETGRAQPAAPVISIFSAIYAFLAPIHSPSSLQFRCSFHHSNIPSFQQKRARGGKNGMVDGWNAGERNGTLETRNWAGAGNRPRRSLGSPRERTHNAETGRITRTLSLRRSIHRPVSSLQFRCSFHHSRPRPSSFGPPMGGSPPPCRSGCCRRAPHP